MSDISDFDSFLIGRPEKFSLSVAYDVYDTSGSKLLDVKSNFLGEYSLQDQQKSLCGLIKRKMMSITPTYELLDKEKKMIGKCVQEFNIQVAGLQSPMTYILEDVNSNKIAHLKIQSPLAVIFNSMNAGQGANQSISNALTYAITSMDDTKTFAKINIQRNTGYEFMTPGMANFGLAILDNTIPKLLLLEFVIAVDHMFCTPQQGPANLGSGNMGGFGGMPMGGGGMGIKL